MRPTLFDQLIVMLQRLLPARALGRCVHWLSRRRDVWLKNLLINGFCTLFQVDKAEAGRPVPAGYASFNEFFTRELKPGVRPLTRDARKVLSPVDGTLAQLGHASAGQLMEAKGARFSAAALLGDHELATRLAAAPFATLYLAPHNYHRIHMPANGQLRATHFIPGRLHSVNARTVAVIPDLYALNERLVCHFEGEHGEFALVLVGALNVASISTQWSGEITVPPGSGRVTRRWPNASGPALRQGDYVGHFNLGSTVVLLGPPAALRWNSDRAVGQPVLMGEPLGTLPDP